MSRSAPCFTWWADPQGPDCATLGCTDQFAPEVLLVDVHAICHSKVKANNADWLPMLTGEVLGPVVEIQGPSPTTEHMKDDAHFDYNRSRSGRLPGWSEGA